jgi:hypothetical protein
MFLRTNVFEAKKITPIVRKGIVRASGMLKK